MRKCVFIHKKDLVEFGYQKAPIKQILNLNLSAEEQIVLLNFFSNSESWTLSINSIAENSFYTPKNRSRIKKIINKLIEMDYILEDESSYTVNLKSIQKDYNLNKLPDILSINTLSNSTESITPTVTQSTSKDVTESIIPSVTLSTPACYPESHKNDTVSTTNNNNNNIIEEEIYKSKKQSDKLYSENSGSKEFEDLSSVNQEPEEVKTDEDIQNSLPILIQQGESLRSILQGDSLTIHDFQDYSDAYIAHIGLSIKLAKIDNSWLESQKNLKYNPKHYGGLIYACRSALDLEIRTNLKEELLSQSNISEKDLHKHFFGS